MALLYGTNTRVKSNETARKNALAESNKVYEQAITNTNQVLNKNNAYADQYLQKNSEMLDAQTNLDINKIEQQKVKTEDNYNKAAKTANKSYIDSINRYGVEAELRAQNGLNSGGYVGMKNLVKFEENQKTLGEARVTANQTIQELNNQISQAKLENSSKKAEYSLEVAKMKLEAQVEQMQKQSELLIGKLESKQNLNNTYDSLYMQIVDQINAEKDRAESKRQFEQQLAYQKKQDAITNSYAKKELELRKKYG